MGEKKLSFGVGLYLKIVFMIAAVIVTLAFYPAYAWAITGDSPVNPARTEQEIKSALADPSVGTIYLAGSINLSGVIDVSRPVAFAGTEPSATVLVAAKGSWHFVVHSSISVSFGALSLQGPPIHDSTRQNGGIQANDPGSTLSLTTCILTGNADLSYYNGGITSYGTVYMDSCTLSENVTRYGDGGAVSGKDIYLTNCTFSNNAAASQGGAVYGSNTVTLNQCTFSGNVVGLRDSQPNLLQGGAVWAGAALTMEGTIISGNYAIDGTPNEIYVAGVPYEGGATAGTVQDSFGGYANIIGLPPGSLNDVDSLATIMQAQMNPIITTSIMRPVGVLAPHGGPTPTILITAGGVADDAILPDLPPTALPLFDQRGISRPQGPAADVGAVELVKISSIGLGPSQTMTVGDTLSLHPDISPAATEGTRVLSWTSSNPAVATVDSSGVVTGLTPGTAIITAAAQDGSAVSGTVQIEVLQAMPLVTGISPDSGPSSGGTEVTMRGKAFTGATKVTVGGISVSTFTVVDDATIVFTTPAGSVGAADVVVTTPGGMSAPVSFTYTAPPSPPDNGKGTGTGTGVPLPNTGDESEEGLWNFSIAMMFSLAIIVVLAGCRFSQKRR